MFFGNFGGNFGDFGCQGPPKVTCRHPGRLRDDFLMIFDGFGLPLGSPGEHFGGHLGARISHLTRLCQFFGVFFGASEKGAKKVPNVLQKGAFLEAVDMAQV